MWLKERKKEWFGLLLFLNLSFLFLFFFSFFVIGLKLLLWGFEFFPETILKEGAHPYTLLELGEKYHGGPVYQLWLDELSKPIPRKNRFEIGGYFSEELTPYLANQFSVLEKEKEVENLLKIAVESKSLSEMEREVDQWFSSYLESGKEAVPEVLEGWTLKREKIQDLSLEDYLRLRQLLEWRYRFLLQMNLPGLEEERGEWKKREVLPFLEDCGYQGIDWVQNTSSLNLFRVWNLFLIVFNLDNPLETLHTYDLFAPRMKDRMSFVEREFPAYAKIAKEDPKLVLHRWVGAPVFFLEQYRRTWVDPNYVKPTSYMERLPNYLAKVRYRVLDYYLERAERKYFYQLNRMIPDLYKFDVKLTHRFGHPQLTWLRRLKRYRMTELLYDYGIRIREKKNYGGWRIQPRRTRKGKVVRDSKGKPKFGLKTYAKFLKTKENGVTVTGKHHAFVRGALQDPRFYVKPLIRTQGKEKLAKAKHYFFFHYWGEKKDPGAAWWYFQERDLLDRPQLIHPVYGYYDFYHRIYVAIALNHNRMSNRKQNSYFPRGWVNYESSYGKSLYDMKDYLPPSFWNWVDEKNRLSRGSFELGFRRWFRWKWIREGFRPLVLGRKFYVVQPDRIPQPICLDHFAWPWISKKYRNTTYAGGIAMRETWGEWAKSRGKRYWLGQEGFFQSEKWWSSWLESGPKDLIWFGTPSNVSFQNRVRLAHWLAHLPKGAEDGTSEKERKESFGWGTSYHLPNIREWTFGKYLNYLLTGWWLESHIKSYLIVISSVWIYVFYRFLMTLFSSWFFWSFWVLFLCFFFGSAFWLAGQSEDWLSSQGSPFWSSMEKREFQYLFQKTFYRWDKLEWNGISFHWFSTNWYGLDRIYYSIYGNALMEFGKKTEFSLTFLVVRVFLSLGALNFLVGVGLYFFCFGWVGV